MLHNFCFSFVLEYDNVLYANEVETKEKQKLLNIKNELQHMYMGRTYRKIWSLQSTGIFRCVINLDIRLTRVGASQKMIPRERLMRQNREGPALLACLPLLHVPLSPTLKKIPALQARKCAHRANSLTINEWGWVSYKELRRSRRVWDLHNSSYETKAEFNNCFIIYSK